MQTATSGSVGQCGIAVEPEPACQDPLVTTAETRCPSCSSRSLARVGSDPPWCPACGWNLDNWPGPARKRGRATLLRGRRRAFRINAELLEELSGSRPERPRPTRARTLMLIAALALLCFDLGLLGGGGYLIATGQVPLKIVGAFMVLVGL